MYCTTKVATIRYKWVGMGAGQRTGQQRHKVSRYQRLGRNNDLRFLARAKCKCRELIFTLPTTENLLRNVYAAGHRRKIARLRRWLRGERGRIYVVHTTVSVLNPRSRVVNEGLAF